MKIGVRAPLPWFVKGRVGPSCRKFKASSVRDNEQLGSPDRIEARTGTMKELGQVHVREEILTSVRKRWPARMLQECLLPQLFGDAKALERSEASDARAPILVFGLPRRRPCTGDELTNTARHHTSILPRRLVTSQCSKREPHAANIRRARPPSLV